MRAVLKKSALLSILCATVETFKKECFLILLGHQKKDNFIIEHAVAIQTAKRKFTDVEITSREKLVLMLSEFFFKNSQPIGDCHSHTEFGKGRPNVTPSKQDEWTSKKNEAYVIVGISAKRKIQQWKKIKDGGIIGSIGRYKFEIKAYVAPEKGKLEQIPLICPSAYRLNAFKK